MSMRIHARVRSALIVLGVLAGLCAPAAATPLAGAARTAVETAASPHAAVQINHRYRCYRYGNCRRSWNDGRRYRRYYRPYRRHLYVRPWPYYAAPTYRYVQPRRSYRYRLTSAHVRWCYDRYRSYREWDNTYQPYHGRRRQCWSPYS